MADFTAEWNIWLLNFDINYNLWRGKIIRQLDIFHTICISSDGNEFLNKLLKYMIKIEYISAVLSRDQKTDTN